MTLLKQRKLTAAGLAPTNPLESGIAATLPPGLYTALCSQAKTMALASAWWKSTTAARRSGRKIEIRSSKSKQLSMFERGEISKTALVLIISPFQ